LGMTPAEVAALRAARVIRQPSEDAPSLSQDPLA
jgi:hypothetical protein